MTFSKTLHTKIVVNELSLSLVTHTAYFDTRFGHHGLLKLGYDAELILDKLNKEVKSQV
jgi:hypothetical protein